MSCLKTELELSSEEVIEVLENLQVFSDTLISIEKKDFSFEASEFNQLFRILHSLKGLLSMFDRGEVKALHYLETVLKKYENNSKILPEDFELLLKGTSLCEKSIQGLIPEDFFDQLKSTPTEVRAIDNQLDFIFFCQHKEWPVIQSLKNNGINSYRVFHCPNELYKLSDAIKNVKKFIISDKIEIIDPSSLIKVLNFANNNAEIILIRENSKCNLDNVNDILFQSFGVKDRNFEKKLIKILNRE